MTGFQGLLRVIVAVLPLGLSYSAWAECDPAEAGAIACEAACDDGNECTVDTVDPTTGGCVHTPRVGPCDDGSPCTSGDACVGTVCTGTPVACPLGPSCASAFCGAAGACEASPQVTRWVDTSQPTEASGEVQPAAAYCGPLGWTGGTHLLGTGSSSYSVELDPGVYRLWIRYAAEHARPVDVFVDGHLIIDDALDATTGSWCGDTVQWAHAGVVAVVQGGAHTIRLEHDASVCCFPHIDALLLTNVLDFAPPAQPWGETYGPADDPVFEPEGAACDDGDACTVGGACAAGACVGGLAVLCDDGDPCTADTCEPGAGCVHTPTAGPDCAFTLQAVIPSATEVGVVRELELVGEGLALTTDVLIEGMEIQSWQPTADGTIAAVVAVPDTPDVFSVTVTNGATGESSTLQAAIVSLASGYCPALHCGGCALDADCVEGDPCTTDICQGGLCQHVPSASCCTTEACDACSTAGDVTASGAVGVADVQCTILVSLWSLSGKQGAPPGCLAVPVASVDADCDGAVGVSDVLITIVRALSMPLDAAIDADGDGCHDACAAVPTLSCGPDTTVFTSSPEAPECAATLTPSAPGAMACAPPVLVQSGPGTATAVCTTVAPSGASATCTQSLTVVDDAAPSVACTPLQPLECAGPCATPAVATATATDDCGPATVSCPEAGALFCLGDTAVTCTASDAAGNEATCEGVVRVVDTMPPVVSCVSWVEAPAEAGGVALVPDFLASAADACAPTAALTISQDPAVGTAVPLGEHPIQVLVGDPSGNVGSCHGTFRVSGVVIQTVPYGEVAVYEEAEAEGGDPCLAGPTGATIPGSADEVWAVACSADGFETVSHLEYRARRAFELAGELDLRGTYDDESGRICLTAKTGLDYPDTIDALYVRVCFAPGGAGVESETYFVTTFLPPIGLVELEGPYDAPSDRLCLQGTTGIPVPTVVGDLYVESCLLEGATVVESVEYRGVVSTPLGEVDMEGTFDPITKLLCIDGTIATSMSESSIDTDAFVCLNFPEPHIPIFESAKISMNASFGELGSGMLFANFGGPEPVCFNGKLESDLSTWLDVDNAQLLDLSVTTCTESGQLTTPQVRAVLRLNEGASAVTLEALGTPGPAGGWQFSLGLAKGCQSSGCEWADACPANLACTPQWTPFAVLEGAPAELRTLVVQELTGTLTIGIAEPSIELSAQFTNTDGGLTLVPGSPGLVLEAVRLTGSIRKFVIPPGEGWIDAFPPLGGDVATPGVNATLFSVALEGSLSIPLDSETLLVDARGEIFTARAQVAGDTFEQALLLLSGDVTTASGGVELEPLAPLLGEGVFVASLNDATAALRMDLLDGEVRAEISANASLDLFDATVDFGTQITLFADEQGWGLAAAAVLQHLELPVGDDTLTLGEHGAVVFVATTTDRYFYKVDADGDPSNGKELVLPFVPAGLTLVAQADLPFLDDLFPGASAMVTVRVESSLGFGVLGTLALPLTLVAPEHQLPGIHRLRFESVDFTVYASPIAAQVGFGGTASFEPTDADGDPLPALTAHGSFLADSLGAFGGTLSLQGLWKEPLFIPRFAFMNPGLSLKIAIDLATGVPILSSLGVNAQAFFLKEGEWPEAIALDGMGNPTNLPEGIYSVGATVFYDRIPTDSGLCFVGKCVPLPTLLLRYDLQNLTLQDLVDVANFFREGALALASTPEFEPLAELIGAEALEPIDISPLALEVAELSVYLSTHDTRRFGTSFTTGVRLAVDASVTDLSATEHFVKLDGYLSPKGVRLIGHSSPLTFIPGLDIVGDPFRRKVALQGGSVLVPDSDALDSARSVEAWVEVAGPGAAIDKLGPAGGYALEIGPLAPAACEEGEPCPDAHTLALRIRDGAEERVVASEHGVVPPGTPHHIAAAIREDGAAALYVDGVSVPHTSPGPGALPAPSDAPLRLGQGLVSIDDVRLWNVARTPVEVRSESRAMGLNFRIDPRLVARYEVDFDDHGDVAHNSKLAPPVAAHGTYQGSAAPAITPEDQDLYLKVVLDPTASEPGGLFFQAGLALDLDPPLPGANLSYAGSATLGAGQAQGTLYARELGLLSLDGWGQLRLTGNGPNGVEGDFDDGLYLHGDLLTGPSPSLNASSRLLFIGPDGVAKKVAESNFVFTCEVPTGCSGPHEYTLRSSGLLDMQVPFGSTTLSLQGTHAFDTDTLAFHLEGSLTAFGQTLAATDIRMDKDAITLTASLNLETAGPLPIDLDSALEVAVTYAPPRMCASGTTALSVANLGSFWGAVDTCLGDDASFQFQGSGSLSLAGFTLHAPSVQVSDAGGLVVDGATLSVPGLYEGEVSGYYKSDTDFELVGSSTLDVGPLVQVTSLLTLAPGGAQIQVAVQGGLVQATLSGAITGGAGGVQYDLQGAAAISVGGFTLANGALRVRSAQGWELSGTVDLGIGAASLEGTYQPSSGEVSLAGALSGSLLGGQLTTAGDVLLGSGGASVSGTIALFGSSAGFLTLIAGHAGGPGAFNLTTQIDLSLPTAAGAFPLDAGSTLVVHHTPGQPLTAALSGQLTFGALHFAVAGSVAPATWSMSGAVVLGPPSGPSGQGTLSLGPAGGTASIGLAGGPGVQLVGQLVPSSDALVLSGTVTMGGYTFPPTTISVGPFGASFATAVDLGTHLGHPLGTASLALSYEYAPFSLCGAASVPFPLDPAQTCTASGCLSFAGAAAPPTVALHTFDCLGLCLNDTMCGPDQFCDALGHCHGKKVLDAPCAGLLVGDHECLSGFCDIWRAAPVPVCGVPLPDGTGCLADGQCISGQCGNRPGTLARHCYTPGERWLGQECFDVAHCAEGTCWGLLDWPSRCLCTANAECATSPVAPPASVCKLGDWGITASSGQCIPPRQAGEACVATSECAVGLACGGGQCYLPASQHNWQACAVNEHCISGACFHGQCRCTGHGDCAVDPAFGSNSYCDMGPWLTINQEGRCHAPREPDGSYCEDAAWCLSGVCDGGVCITPKSKSNWQSCARSAECIAGACFAGTCRCDAHQHCAVDPAFGPASYCNMGTWLATNQEGRCHVPREPDGAYCEDAAWCLSGVCDDGLCITPKSKSNWQSCARSAECIAGACFAGTCRCDAHQHCADDPAFGPDSFCDMGPWLPTNQEGRCYAPKNPNDAYCEDGAWCQSGACNANVCYQPGAKSNWESCVSDDECIGGACFNWQCRCYAHAHCTHDPHFGPDSYCDMGPWTVFNAEGQCKSGKQPSNVGAYCEDGGWCQSGLCGWSANRGHSVCYADANWPHGTSCDQDLQCGPDPALRCTNWGLFHGWKCGY